MRRLYGAGGQPADGTLDVYLRAWLKDVKPTIAPSTWTSYAGHVKDHISPLLGGIPVSKLRTSDVRRLIADRLVATSPKTHRPLSPTTVGLIVTTLRMALASGVGDAALTSNVAAHVRLPRKAEHRVEDCLKRAKSEAGLADYEVRTWSGWHHHQALSLIAIWFLTEETRRGKKNHGGDHRAADSRNDFLIAPSQAGQRSSGTDLSQPYPSLATKRARQVPPLQIT